MLALLNNKNYSMVAYTGPDCVFVDNAELDNHNIQFEGQNNVEQLGVLDCPEMWSPEYFYNNTFFMNVGG